jgi:hypothetical protein
VIPQLPLELGVESAAVDEDPGALACVDDRAAVDPPANRLLGEPEVVGGRGDGEPAALVVTTRKDLFDPLGHEEREQLERVGPKDAAEPLAGAQRITSISPIQMIAPSARRRLNGE